MPSAERAKGQGCTKSIFVGDCCDQVSPPLVEVARVKTLRLVMTATMFEPLAEQAQPNEFANVSRDVQVTPESSEVYTWPEGPSVVAISLPPSNDDATQVQSRAASRAVQLVPELMEV